MKINKEGFLTILIAAVVLTAIVWGIDKIGIDWITKIIGILALATFCIIIWFFRMPARDAVINDDLLIAPSDGKIVIIEKVFEPEYFKDERIQVSIFMSPLNVHAQWYPINGKVNYYKYHPGKYLVAYHPKSSTLNERSTLVLENKKGKEVLVRQIAGALARRIVTYANKPGMVAEQGKEFGFIKFGSRIDLYFPLGTDITVELDQKVTGSITEIAKF